MSVTATIQNVITVRETLETGIAAASKKLIHSDLYNFSKEWSATAAPTTEQAPITKAALYAKALAAGVGTIDLTALPGINGAVVDGTGLKVQAIRIENPRTNANPLRIFNAAANSYNLAGATYDVTLRPGDRFTLTANDDAGRPDVGAAAKNISLSDVGVLGTESCKVTILLG